MDLEREFSAILDRPSASRDFRFCSDARDAAASAARNIAEGFGRKGAREFLRFVRIAYGSQCETQTNILIAHQRGYVTAAERDRLLALSSETTATTRGLINTLRRFADER